LATIGLANAVLIFSLCPPPLLALSVAAAPATLVKLKLACEDASLVEAVTVKAPAV
jgi:hypothetical protein